MSTSLASIIIPCYNAERWIAEAVQSCLDQTYAPLEIIVIDDGSTDESLQVLAGFGDKITVETGPNRGGNHARNRGIALSTGDYIQFLDADDYLLPEKIERQVQFLEETGTDVVYGDWRHRHHLPDGTDYLDEVKVSGAQEDILESLLSGWWVPANCLLFRRESVVKAGGWDEALKAAQDKDFFLSVALTGADIRYQPGCHSIYRRYGNVTVSTSNLLRWLKSHQMSLEKAEGVLDASGRLSSKYRSALAHAYYIVAHNYYDLDRAEYNKLLKKILSLSPHFRPQKSRYYNTAQKMLGFRLTERLAGSLRKLKDAK